MNRTNLFLIAFLLTTTSCSHKSITIVEGVVLDNDKKPISGVEINTIVNNIKVSGEVSEAAFDSLMNADGMVKLIKPVITDSTGKFQFGLIEKYVFNQPKIKLSIHKEHFNDTLLILTAGQANSNIVVQLRSN